MDGHVKSMKPYATISVANGGSGSTNMWSRTGVNYTATDLNIAKNSFDKAVAKYN